MRRERDPARRQAPCQSRARHGRALNRPGVPGGPCSEVKEEAQPGDIRGRGRPAIRARAHTSHIKNSVTAHDTTQSLHIDTTSVHPSGAIPC